MNSRPVWRNPLKQVVWMGPGIKLRAPAQLRERVLGVTVWHALCRPAQPLRRVGFLRTVARTCFSRFYHIQAPIEVGGSRWRDEDERTHE